MGIDITGLERIADIGGYLIVDNDLAIIELTTRSLGERTLFHRC